MERIGLLSDSHGRAEITGRAANVLAENGAQLLIHLGDIETEAVIDALAGVVKPDGEVIPVHIVFGNCDWQREHLARCAGYQGIVVDDPVGRLEINGRVLVYQHGHEPRRMREALDEPVDWLCHGHTHLPRDEKVGSTRVINPGALFRASQHTIAMLDTSVDSVTFYPVAKA